MRWRRRTRGTMFITGATGYLGRHLTAAASAAGWQLLALPHATLDVRNRDRVLHEIASWGPTAVVHLACRRDERDVIVDGSRHVAEGAARAGARLVHMSTDLVFAGRVDAYTELDTPDATLEYGRWKAEAEMDVHRVHPEAVMVRTSLLYGADHAAPPQRDVTDAIAGRRPMTFFTDEYRCPVDAADMAAALVRLAELREVSGPLHVAGPEAISRADLAAAFAHHMGLDESRLVTGTLAESGLRRPSRVVLDSSAAAALGITCRSVEEALRRPTG